MSAPRIGTLLTPHERGVVEAARGPLVFAHRESVQGIRGDLAAGTIDAVLVSTAIVSRADVSTLSALVHGFPGTLFVGLVAGSDDRAAALGAYAFGLAGFGGVVDVRTVGGWASLRAAFDARRVIDPFMQRAVRELSANDCTAGWARFLALAFSPGISTTEQVAASVGINCQTLTSRFFRAHLWSPKNYIGHAQFVWAAHLGETPGLSLSAIARRIGASSPQAFQRTVRTTMCMTAAEFRRQFTGEVMLAEFRRMLIDPYRETLRTFDPLVSVSERARARRAA